MRKHLFLFDTFLPFFGPFRVLKTSTFSKLEELHVPLHVLKG